jgi:hypothetical protein
MSHFNDHEDLKNGVFWVVTPCGSCKNRRFGGTWRLLHQGNKNHQVVFLRSVRRLLVAACVVPSSRIFVTLMKEAPGSSETSVLTRATRRNNTEDTSLHSHRRENLKSYIMKISLTHDKIYPIILHPFPIETIFVLYIDGHLKSKECRLLGWYAVWIL